jgi:hypothetical protein
LFQILQGLQCYFPLDISKAIVLEFPDFVQFALLSLLFPEGAPSQLVDAESGFVFGLAQ